MEKSMYGTYIFLRIYRKNQPNLVPTSSVDRNIEISNPHTFRKRNNSVSSEAPWEVVGLKMASLEYPWRIHGTPGIFTDPWMVDFYSKM